MIVIFTDYGMQGPYLGQVNAVLARLAPGEQRITLMADAPRYNPRVSAYLLAAFSREFPPGSVFFAVVDPGVGSDVDKPVIVNADERWYVGPDNGLFDLVVRRAGGLKTWEISWRPENLSGTFHGRDLYAPVCGMLCKKGPIPGNEFAWTDRHGWPDDLPEIIYIDHFGNLMTGIRAGQLDPTESLRLKGTLINAAGFFSEVEKGQLFWYENSHGLVEIAVNQGSARDKLSASLGDRIE